MDTLLHSQGFWAVVGAVAGAVVGLLGGEGIRTLREMHMRKRRKSLFIEELKTILEQIYQKKDIISKMRELKK